MAVEIEVHPDWTEEQVEAALRAKYPDTYPPPLEPHERGARCVIVERPVEGSRQHAPGRAGNADALPDVAVVIERLNPCELVMFDDDHVETVDSWAVDHYHRLLVGHPDQDTDPLLVLAGSESGAGGIGSWRLCAPDDPTCGRWCITRSPSYDGWGFCIGGWS